MTYHSTNVPTGNIPLLYWYVESPYIIEVEYAAYLETSSWYIACMNCTVNQYVSDIMSSVHPMSAGHVINIGAPLQTKTYLYNLL